MLLASYPAGVTAPGREGVTPLQTCLELLASVAVLEGVPPPQGQPPPPMCYRLEEWKIDEYVFLVRGHYNMAHV